MATINTSNIFNKLNQLACPFFIVLFLLSLSVKAQAQPGKLTRILFILDASNSMNGRWQSGKKSIIANKLLSEALDSLQYRNNLELALRVYGHQKPFPPQDCDDTKLEVPFAKNNSTRIKNKLKSLTSQGTTPIAMTLEEAGNDFPSNDSRNIIILITDGIEECEGDPCAVSMALQKKGIILQPFVIGIGLDMEFKESFKCIGNFFDASDEKTFRNVLNIVIDQALNATTAQVNLLDQSGLPTETDVNMTFYDGLGRIQYNYVHTINHRGDPDTIPLDPIPTYKMVVHTIPPVEKEGIKLVAGKHNIIAADAPQGYLKLKSGITKDVNIPAIVRKNGELKTLHVQEFNNTEKYIVGNYDLEILTLPRTYINDVNIKQSHTTTVEVPAPGIATIITNTSGYGSLYLLKGSDMKWVYNMKSDLPKETLNLQPGHYKIVYRSKASKQSIYTIEKTFKVESGSSQLVKVF